MSDERKGAFVAVSGEVEADIMQYLFKYFNELMVAKRDGTWLWVLMRGKKEQS
ncbi:hypothetical protein MASR2M15_10780 [Anaerolineales bacterium]